MIALSILDLVRVTQEGSARQAFDSARDLARHAESLGYRRYWVAEHHNMPGVACTATALVIAHIAAGTETIRVGSGGIMLPNHVPLVIAEQFGTLATLFPGRIELGLGRAPGTDPLTTRALRRHPASADSFPHDVQELQGFLRRPVEGQRVRAFPVAETEVPIWILGSSTFGAQLAGELGLPFAFASHFAPASLLAALDVYRRCFRPSSQCQSPYALVGVNIIAADAVSQARRLATTQQMSFTNLVRGTPGLSRPPIDDIDSYWTATEKAQAQQMLANSIIGGPEEILSGMQSLVAATGANELILVSDIYDHSARRRSIEIAIAASRQVAS